MLLNMKLLRHLLGNKKPRRQTVADYKEEIILQQAKEQFKKLTDRGLNVPVAYL
jgi:hypothetical protein